MIPKINQGEVVWAEHYARYIFSSFFVGGKVVLDVACGTGYGSFYLAKKGAKKVFGVDNSEDAIAYAKREFSHPKVEYLVGDAQDLKLSDRSVDVVVSLETIEHVPDFKKFLGEVTRVLKKDGLFIVSTPNEKVFPPDSPWHKKEFTLREFKEVLKKLFKNIDLFYQDNWVTNGILKAKTAGASDIYHPVKQVDLFKIDKRKAKDALYFLALCSNAPIPKEKGEVAALYSFAAGVADWIQKQRVAEKRLQRKITTLQTNLIRTRTSLDEVHRSRSWRFLTSLRKFKTSIPIIGKL